MPKLLVQNKKAYHDFFIEEKYEAGLVLAGTEVKSIRMGTINIKDSYCTVRDGELLCLGMHISPYEKGNIFNKDPLREKKLLMHKNEILRLFGYVKQEGYSIIPLSVYLKGPIVKVEIGLCKGKKLHDKREATAERDAQRDIQRSMRDRNK